MAQGKVEICGVNTSRLPILNDEEKAALFIRIKAGDQEAKEEYKKTSIFQKVLHSLTKGRKTLKRLTPEDVEKMQRVEAVKRIFSQRYNTDITMELQKDGYLVTMPNGKSIKLNDNDINKLYNAGLNSEVVAEKSL